MTTRKPKVEKAFVALREALRVELRAELEQTIRAEVAADLQEELREARENARIADECLEDHVVGLLQDAIDLLVADRTCPAWRVDSRDFIARARARISELDSGLEHDNSQPTIFEGRAA